MRRPTQNLQFRDPSPPQIRPVFFLTLGFSALSFFSAISALGFFPNRFNTENTEKTRPRRIHRKRARIPSANL